MGSFDLGPEEDPNEYRGQRWLGPGAETNNVPIKQVLTDTSGQWHAERLGFGLTRWTRRQN
jgi:hypothetical protein